MNRGVIGAIIGVLVIIILVIVIMRHGVTHLHVDVGGVLPTSTAGHLTRGRSWSQGWSEPPDPSTIWTTRCRSGVRSRSPTVTDCSPISTV